MKLKDWLIFENNEFVVLNKPSGLLSIPDREGKEISLKELLKKEYGEIFTVHRLDRGTSGLIVFAKNAETHKNLSLQFEGGKTRKIYLGLVIGSLEVSKGTINAPIAEHPVKKGMMVIDRKGKESITEYELLCDFKIYSWMQFRILTGRTHQIRIHMKDIGHPIVCDDLYGDGKPLLVSSLKHRFKLSRDQEVEIPILGRLALHSSELEFEGLDGNKTKFEAPIPKDLRATLKQLEKRMKKTL